MYNRRALDALTNYLLCMQGLCGSGFDAIVAINACNGVSGTLVVGQDNLTMSCGRVGEPDSAFDQILVQDAAVGCKGSEQDCFDERREIRSGTRVAEAHPAK